MYGFWPTVRQYGVNTLWFTATMLSMLLEIDDGEDLSWLPAQIRLGLVGMAPLSPAVKERFEKRFGFQLQENYALSETLFLTSQRAGGPHAPGSSGSPLPGISVTIIDEAGQSLPAGVEGEIKIDSPYPDFPNM
jgi:acyl-coenzyme A synthetase/AMP-(fatty) acid ligase